MVCGTGSSVNESDKRLSIFDVVDKITINPLPTPPPGHVLVVKMPVWHAFAVWLHNDDEPWDQEYDFEYRVVLPDGKPITIGGGTFKFQSDPAKLPFYRLGALIEQFPSMKSGIIKLENRIRRKGTEDQWSSQFYPIVVEEGAPEELTKLQNGPADPNK